MRVDSEKTAGTDNARRELQQVLCKVRTLRPLGLFPRRYTYAVRVCSDFGTFSKPPLAFTEDVLSLEPSAGFPDSSRRTGGSAGPRTHSSSPEFASRPLPRCLSALYATSQISLRALLLLVLMGLSEDVLEYLFWAKTAEEDAWLRDDIAIAIRTCALAAEGVPHPDVCATYEVLGLHPNEVWARIEDRRRAILGPLYEAFYGAGAAETNPSDLLPPRKSPQPVLTKKAAA